MNTAPKLRDLATQFGDYDADERGRESWEFDEYGLSQFAAALAPPSGEGVAPVAWQCRIVAPNGYKATWRNMPAGERQIKCEISPGFRYEYRALYATPHITTPQSAPVDVVPINKALRLLRCGLYDDADETLEAVLEAALTTTPPPASQERGDMVSVSRDHVKWAADVCDSWCLMHREYVEYADIERWEYPPGVEGLAESLREALAASPPSSAAAKEPEQRCPYCAGRIYSAAGCQNCKVGSVWPKPVAAEQAKPETAIQKQYREGTFARYSNVPAEQAKAGEFREWFRKNAPGGTVISDPDWWVDRILRRLAGGVTVDDEMVRRFVDAVNPLRFDLPPPSVIRDAMVAALGAGRG